MSAEETAAANASHGFSEAPLEAIAGIVQKFLDRVQAGHAASGGTSGESGL